MLIYFILVAFTGICSGILLILLGNLIKNTESIFALLGKDIQAPHLAEHREKVLFFTKRLGNLLIYMGVAVILTISYWLLWGVTWGIRSFSSYG